MSEQNDALAAMLDQYEANNKPKYEKKSDKVYDLKNYFNTYIKENVKSAEKTIRILPTSDGSSPFVELHAHKVKVDGQWKTFPCLKHEKNEPCPFCEAREALLATGKESDKELAKSYNARLMYVVKVIDRDNEEEGVKFWRFNHNYKKEGNLDKIQTVLKAIKKNITDPKTGRDLVLSIQRNQNNVPIVTGIASLDPTPLSEDETQVTEWLEDERTWRDVYAERNYDYLEIIVKGGVPAWDNDNKCFVDKATLEDNKSEVDKLDTELTMGVENVKSEIVASKTVTATETATATAEDSSDEDEDDDLPF